jgi:hypothetical protein
MGIALPVTCPRCAQVNDQCDEILGRPVQPQEGNVGICWGCKRVFVFTATATRVPDEEEEARLLDLEPVAIALAHAQTTGSPQQATWLNVRAL